jgi:hypothetical protein
MNTRNHLLLSALAALVLIGCGKEDSAQPATTNDTAKAKASPPVLPNQPPLGAPSSSPTAPSTEGQPMRQTRQRILGEVVELIGKPAAGLSAEHWKTIKARYWKPDFDRVVQPAAKPTNVRDLLAVPKGKESLIAQILTGRFSDISDKAEQDAMLALHTLALVTATSGGTSLPAALEDRKGDANITRGDLILFELLDDAFVDVPRREQVSKAELDQWTELATSPNSLHRLLALRTYRRVAPNPEQWLDFYRGYVNEQDLGILEEVTDMAFQTAKPEAAAVLAEIRARPSAAANPDFAAKLDRSIDFLQKLPSRGQ